MKRKKNKKIVNLVAICSFCAILLSASTYAWFIGMKTVSVNKFDVEIATTEGLFLSMDGKNWKYQLDAKEELPYEKHANQWLEDNGEGLIPMSTVGDMDSTSSRMKLFQKGSLTAVSNGGGYRLLAKQVDNHTKQVQEGTEYLEAPGYVAFDLFVMNLSGDAYYPDNNPLNEEAIYLTTNSKVTVGSGGKENTGIENSIRVGVVQLGRVSAELDLNDRNNEAGANTVSQPIITGMTCASSQITESLTKTDEKYVTGICRDASIWEPNDTKHTLNAMKWYSKGCLKRTGDEVEKEESYSDACLTIPKDTTELLKTYYPTYGISKTLTLDDKVNIYDGLEYNTYTKNTIDYNTYDKANGKLVKLDNFTDTEKLLTGTNRPKFMTLAPNSITKLRVYIWLEGQDIDNYDYAQLGKKVKINFGFTKERFEPSDINSSDHTYDGPSTDLRSVLYTEAKGEIILSGKAISDGVTYNANLKIFTAPSSVNSFKFNDGIEEKTATYQEESNTWNVA